MGLCKYSCTYGEAVWLELILLCRVYQSRWDLDWVEHERPEDREDRKLENYRVLVPINRYHKHHKPHCYD
jgi:hypothetical protein